MRSVLLRHDLPDGTHHYDWMTQRPGGEGSPLVTFRVSVRIDRLRGGELFQAERLADHRAAYLTFEGAVSGGRGWVERVAEGVMDNVTEMEGGFWAQGRLGESVGGFMGRVGHGLWDFRFQAG